MATKAKQDPAPNTDRGQYPPWVPVLIATIGALASVGVAFISSRPAADAALNRRSDQVSGLNQQADKFASSVDKIFAKHSIVAFNLEECPENWKRYTPAEGRYIVGTQLANSLGKVVGTPLKDQEDRAAGRHTHTYKDSGTSKKGAKFSFGSDVQRSEVVRITDVNEGLGEKEIPEGTNAPYVQLLFCERV